MVRHFFFAFYAWSFVFVGGPTVVHDKKRVRKCLDVGVPLVTVPDWQIGYDVMNCKTHDSSRQLSHFFRREKVSLGHWCERIPGLRGLLSHLLLAGYVSDVPSSNSHEITDDHRPNSATSEACCVVASWEGQNRTPEIRQERRSGFVEPQKVNSKIFQIEAISGLWFCAFVWDR